MTDTITARDLASEIADTHDVHFDSALDAVNTYLRQIDVADGTTTDTEEIPADQATAVREAYAAALDHTYISALDDLADIRGKLDALADLQAERIRLVRKALADGARVVDITAASGLTRGRIYQIRDGR